MIRQGRWSNGRSEMFEAAEFRDLNERGDGNEIA